MKQILTHENRRDVVVLLKVLFPFIALIGVGIHYHKFVVESVEHSIVINLGIILGAVYGVSLILSRLIGAMIDFRVIERFGKEAAQGVYMKTLLEQPWLKRRYVRHYLSHIASTGGTLSTQMDQTAIENELHALSGEYESKMELPQFLVGFMIAMGLLGTFIGLLETLTGISSMLDGMGGSGADVQAQFMKLVGELKKPLAGMGIAFSASMFGLIASLMLAIMMTNLRRFISRVIALARNVMHELTEMSARADGVSDKSSRHLSPEDIARMAMERDDASPASGAISNTLIVGKFDLLTRKIEILLQAFEASIAASQKTNDLLGFGPRMKEVGERSLEELKQMSLRDAEQQKTLQSLLEVNAQIAHTMSVSFEEQRSINDVLQSTFAEVKSRSARAGDLQKTMQSLLEINVDGVRATSNVLAGQQELREVAVSMLNVLNVLAASVGDQQQISRQILSVESASSQIATTALEVQKQAVELCGLGLEDLRSLLSAQSEQKKLTQGVLDMSGAAVRGIEANLDIQRDSRSEMVAILRGLIDKMTKGEEINLSEARHLFEIKENFTKLCKSMSVMDIIAAGLSGHSLLLETLIEESRNSNRALEVIQKNIHGQAVNNS